MDMQIIGYLITGILAGLLGGLLGIGGGAIMVPAINLIFDKPIDLAIASSLSCMVFLSLAAAYGHRKNNFVIMPVVVRLIPAATISAVIGVLARGLIATWVIYFLFALFMVYTACSNTRKVISPKKAREEVKEFKLPNGWIVPLVAAVMGFSSGLLGIGGGVVAVPALNIIVGMPFKNAVACSSVTIIFSSAVAAVVKLLSIHGAAVPANGASTILNASDALLIAACMVPTALVFGRVGAHLTRIAPTKLVRAIFVVVLIWAGYKYINKGCGDYTKWKNEPAVVSSAQAEPLLPHGQIPLGKFPPADQPPMPRKSL